MKKENVMNGNEKEENVLILPQLLIINCNSLLTFNF